MYNEKPFTFISQKWLLMNTAFRRPHKGGSSVGAPFLGKSRIRARL